MRKALLMPIVIIATAFASAQDASVDGESRFATRYALNVINDATFYAGTTAPVPAVLNQALVEPSFGISQRKLWKFNSSLIGLSAASSDTSTVLRVRETYAAISAGDFDLTGGRKMVLWGVGYAFSPAGVLDPPRNPTNPTDRLNLNQGRDMVKVDWIHGSQALSAAWSSAALAPAHTNLRDTTAFRYNILLRGFDTALIAGQDRGSDPFGGLTFTRVVGQAWELHGETLWREQDAALVGAKYTVAGMTFIGELYTRPNTSYDRDQGVFPAARRQYYGFLTAGKSRLRERPGWKEWGVSSAVVANFDDRSYTGVFDTSRWFGNHFSSYVHVEVPRGAKSSEYGSAPYAIITAAGIRFQL